MNEKGEKYRNTQAKMRFGTLRSLIRHISRSISTRSSTAFTSSSSPSSTQFLSKFFSPIHQRRQQLPVFSHFISRSIHLDSLSSLASRPFDPLTDTRFPKRRPSKGRRKRSSLRPPGPFAWVKHVPGEVVPPSQPNEGSVKLRNEKKRRRQRREFIKAERKKRKAQLQEANRKKREKRVERKMEAVARERDWAYRLVELQRLEAEKKQTVA